MVIDTKGSKNDKTNLERSISFLWSRERTHCNLENCGNFPCNRGKYICCYLHFSSYLYDFSQGSSFAMYAHCCKIHAYQWLISDILDEYYKIPHADFCHAKYMLTKHSTISLNGVFLSLFLKWHSYWHSHFGRMRKARRQFFHHQSTKFISAVSSFVYKQKNDEDLCLQSNPSGKWVDVLGSSIYSPVH